MAIYYFDSFVLLVDITIHPKDFCLPIVWGTIIQLQESTTIVDVSTACTSAAGTVKVVA